MSDGPRPRILAILLGLVGDTLMRVPAVRAVRERHPDARIVAICDPLVAPALRDDPLFDRVLAYRRHGASLGYQAGFIRELRRERFDVAIDFYFGGRTFLLAWLSGARRRIGPAKNWQARLLLNEKVAYPLPAVHMIDRNLELVRPLGVNAVERRWHFPVSDATRAALGARLAAAGLTDVPGPGDVVVSAGAGDISKRWDDRFLDDFVARVAAGALDAPRRVLVVADQRDVAISERLRPLPGVVILPRLELSELGALFAGADLVFVGDTGPLHVALGCAPRVLTFYQSTDPAIHRASRPGYRYLYRAVCPYQPCDTRDKDRCQLECRRSITVDEMLQAARELVAP